jgi:hypothetical protein
MVVRQGAFHGLPECFSPHMGQALMIDVARSWFGMPIAVTRWSAQTALTRAGWVHIGAYARQYVHGTQCQTSASQSQLSDTTFSRTI